MSISAQDAAKELLARRQARDNYIDYCKYVYSNYEDPEHVHILAEALEAVERGECTRLMVFMPPRHSKSLNCSVLFPAYYLSKHPERSVVQVGHSADLSGKHSRDSRQIYTSAEHTKLFKNTGKLNFELDTKKTNKEWETAKGGSYYATGVGGALVGRGADLLLLDDLYKSREDAGSELRRDRVLDWYRSVAYTRLMPAASIIMITTRWHPDDLAGFLLRDQPNTWEVISMPAQTDEYDALWPERYPADDLATIRGTIGSREWSAQYMCNPVPQEGNMFNCTKIDIIPESDFPAVKYLRAWDLASTQRERTKKDPDYTVGALGAVTKDSKGLKHLWIKELILGQWDAPDRNKRIIAAANRDGPQTPVYVESFGAYKDTFKEMQRLLAGRNIVRSSRLPGDKVLKASTMEPIFEAGNVHIAKAVWNDKFKSQFLSFPAGAHDDIVDACAIIVGESYKAKSSLMMA